MASHATLKGRFRKPFQNHPLKIPLPKDWSTNIPDELLQELEGTWINTGNHCERYSVKGFSVSRVNQLGQDSFKLYWAARDWRMMWGRNGAYYLQADKDRNRRFFFQGGRHGRVEWLSTRNRRNFVWERIDGRLVGAEPFDGHQACPPVTSTSSTSVRLFSVARCRRPRSPAPRRRSQEKSRRVASGKAEHASGSHSDRSYRDRSCDRSRSRRLGQQRTTTCSARSRSPHRSEGTDSHRARVDEHVPRDSNCLSRHAATRPKPRPRPQSPGTLNGARRPSTADDTPRVVSLDGNSGRSGVRTVSLEKGRSKAASKPPLSKGAAVAPARRGASERNSKDMHRFAQRARAARARSQMKSPREEAVSPHAPSREAYSHRSRDRSLSSDVPSADLRAVGDEQERAAAAQPVQQAVGTLSPRRQSLGGIQRQPQTAAADSDGSSPGKSRSVAAAVAPLRPQVSPADLGGTSGGSRASSSSSSSEDSERQRNTEAPRPSGAAPGATAVGRERDKVINRSDGCASRAGATDAACDTAPSVKTRRIKNNAEELLGPTALTEEADKADPTQSSNLGAPEHLVQTPDGGTTSLESVASQVTVSDSAASTASGTHYAERSHMPSPEARVRMPEEAMEEFEKFKAMHQSWRQKKKEEKQRQQEQHAGEVHTSALDAAQEQPHPQNKEPDKTVQASAAVVADGQPQHTQTTPEQQIGKKSESPSSAGARRTDDGNQLEEKMQLGADVNSRMHGSRLQEDAPATASSMETSADCVDLHKGNAVAIPDGLSASDSDCRQNVEILTAASRSEGASADGTSDAKMEVDIADGIRPKATAAAHESDSVISSQGARNDGTPQTNSIVDTSDRDAIIETDGACAQASPKADVEVVTQSSNTATKQGALTGSNADVQDDRQEAMSSTSACTLSKQASMAALAKLSGTAASPAEGTQACQQASQASGEA